MEKYLRIGITSDFQEELPGIIEPVCQEIFAGYPQIIYEFFDTPLEAIAQQIDQYDALITFHVKYTARSLQNVRRLLIISRWGVGFDVVDLEACNNAGILLTIAPREGVRTPVAEGILAFILALTKGILTRDYLTRNGLWLSKACFPAYDLSSLTLGSIGVGNIGSELFRLAASLGFQRFLATDPYVKPKQVARLKVELVDLPTLLTQADILCINCPLTAETHGMIGKQALSLMKKTAFLINTSRGPIIDETELVEALEQERLAGAALDVFDLEPVESQNPLLQRRDIILSPHSIAFTHGLIRHNTLHACLNILAVFKGELPTTIVNRNVLSNPQLLNKLHTLQKRF